MIGLALSALVGVALTVTVGQSKIASVRERYAEHSDLNEKLKLARGLIDNVNVIIAGFTSIALELESEERLKLILTANESFAALQMAAPKLLSFDGDLLTREKRQRLHDLLASIAHTWEEILRQAGADFTPEEKAHHFLKMQENTADIHDILRQAEQGAEDASTALTHAIHETLQSGANFLLWSMLLGALVSITACGGTVHFAKIIQRANLTIRARDEEVLQKGRRLSAALENIMHGLCMFDSEKRLVVSNSRYATMYGLHPEAITPGMSLREIMEMRAATGVWLSHDDEYIEQWISAIDRSMPGTIVTKLIDKRIVEVSHQPMPDGGWVAIHRDITDQRRSEERIAFLAHHDALTGLLNRVRLREQLDQHLHDDDRAPQLAILCLDLDRFKQVNDTLGHPIGDSLLREVAERLRQCVSERDVVARLGGDEFAIVQIDAIFPTAATKLAQSIVEKLEQPFEIEGHELVVGASIGVALAPDDGTDPDELLKNADLALYRAKDNGRNGFCFFKVGMDAKMQERRRLEIDLRKALAGGEFELHYQPIVDLKQNSVCGFEALLRWRHPVHGVVPPSTFIPLAEETGLITPLGEWVLRQACAEAAKWPDGVKIAVNLSPIQFCNRSVVATVISAMTTAGIEPGRLELEITEMSLLQSNEATLAALYQLQSLGVQVSMDDFGTGYSSLSYLRSFPFNKIKIDRSFVRDLDRNPESLAIVRAITVLGMDLGVRTTVEGVETPEQLARARDYGCSEAQGYLFSRPMPASEVARFLRDFVVEARAAA